MDRLAVKESARRSLTDSVETALGLSGGVVVLDFVDLPETDPHRERMYLRAPGLPLRRPVLRGAGAAVVLVQLPVGRAARTAPASAPGWRSTRSWWSPTRTGPWPGRDRAVERRPRQRLLHPADRGARRQRWGSASTPLGAAPGRGPAGAAVRLRRPGARPVPEPVRAGAVATTPTSRAWCPTSSARHGEAESDSSRERFAGFMREVPCPTCAGARLKPVSLAVTVDGRSDRRLSAHCRSASWPSCCSRWSCPTGIMQIAGRILKEVNARLGFLLDVGLDYLTLDRASATLAGGRRSGSGWRPRSARGWSGSCTCWTSRRSACTSGTTTGCWRRCCACATSATR